MTFYRNDMTCGKNVCVLKFIISGRNIRHYKEKGYAPLYARESFENCWVQYEKLGKNGVMADIRAKFLALPTHNEDQ